MTVTMMSEKPKTYCVYLTAIDSSSLCYCRDNIPGVCSKDAVFRPFNNV